MTTDEIRRRFLEFFESRDHRRLRPNGRNTITAVPRSCASGRIVCSTSRLSTA
jgi:hypothetical protein